MKENEIYKILEHPLFIYRVSQKEWGFRYMKCSLILSAPGTLKLEYN
jgi:hypothetical protein